MAGGTRPRWRQPDSVIVAVTADEPGVIVAARKECPLVVGRGDGEQFLGSAIPAFLEHTRHVQLIEKGIDRDRGGVWADFGAGSGAFTLALRDIAGPDIDLIAIDRDRGSLQTLNTTMERPSRDQAVIQMMRIVADDVGVIEHEALADR